jgi:predicted GH43/DUF377 family glycosyl hydrolase
MRAIQINLYYGAADTSIALARGKIGQAQMQSMVCAMGNSGRRASPCTMTT